MKLSLVNEALITAAEKLASMLWATTPITPKSMVILTDCVLIAEKPAGTFLLAVTLTPVR